MRPTKPLKPSRSRARLATRWTTRLAAAAVLAPVGLTLTATQAPAPVSAHLHQATPPSGPVVSGSWTRDDGVVAALKQASVSSPGGGSSVLEVSPGVDLPTPALRAYQFAEAVMRRADPVCRLDWSLLAAIGDVESDHGRYGGAEVLPDGTSTPRILGPRLDGGGEVAAIADTDEGELDGDGRWDRAVGPMQFIPSTWSLVGADADDDGGRNPHDVDDAALAAAAYLCAGDADLNTTAGQEEAVFRYNHSESYVDLVLQLAAAYADDSFALRAPQPAVRSVSKPVDLPALTSPVEMGAHPAQSPARSLGVQG
nr:lytic transglycosylase domain-containing protein [Actinomycetota bacterium]